jgi:hypothetical protein
MFDRIPLPAGLGLHHGRLRDLHGGLTGGQAGSHEFLKPQASGRID